jgi:hypothetical protein
MKRRRPPARDPILIELVAAIGAGRIEFGPIHYEGEFVHGIARKDGSIRLNPAIEAVDTVLHECCHRLRPKWSERAVRAKVTRLMRELSMPELDKIYEVLLSTASVRKRAEHLV